MAKAVMYVVTRRLDTAFAGYLILCKTDTGVKQKVFQEACGSTADVEIMAANAALDLVERYNWNAEIYCSPNIINWANGNWAANKPSTQGFKQRVDELRQSREVVYVDRPPFDIYNKMAEYLEEQIYNRA